MKIILAEKLELNKFRHFIIFEFFIINDDLCYLSMYTNVTLKKNLIRLMLINS